MAGAEIDAVVAGTRGFALALFSPIAERVGAPPQVATDPAHALVLARGPGSLVVVEFLGEDSLAAIKDLVLDGEGVRIVAAVPPAHDAARAPLRALGVEAVRWDGTPGAVVEAVERQLASAAAPPAAAPRPPAPAGRTAAPAARPAAPGAPTLTPAKPIGAVVPGKRPSPALTPSRPVPAVAKPGVAAPALAPAKPMGGVPVPARAPRPIAKATAPPPATAPAEDALAEPAAPPPEREGGLDDRFFDGFEEDVAAAAEALGAPVAEPSVEPAASAAPGLFDDLDDDDDHAFDVDVDEGAPRLAAPPASADAPWPTAVPGAVEAADALGRGLLGDLPAAGSPLAVVADVIAGLSELERAVFSGAPLPIDTEPVRRAGVMRVRVAAALATAPGAGGAVEPAAVSALLAEIDALLSDVNALSAGAPADVQGSLEAMRNALVKEAIDFSEAVQQAAPAETLVPAEPVARPRTAPARVLSMAPVEDEEPPPRRQRALFVVLAVAALAAGAFHGYRLHDAKTRIRAAPTLPGAPLGAIAPQADGPDVPGLPKMVHAPGAEAFDPAEVRAFAAQEQQKGNAVQEIAPGVIVVVPGGQPPEAR